LVIKTVGVRAIDAEINENAAHATVVAPYFGSDWQLLDGGSSIGSTIRFRFSISF